MASAKIELHQASAFEVALLAALQNRCFPEAPWQEAAIWETLAVPGSLAWIATWRGQPAGYAIMRLIADEAEILSLGVVAGLRRRGVGERLLWQALKEAKRLHATTVFLEVGESNQAAIRLYEKLGFTLAYRRLAYYDVDEDALVLNFKTA